MSRRGASRRLSVQSRSSSVRSCRCDLDLRWCNRDPCRCARTTGGAEELVVRRPTPRRGVLSRRTPASLLVPTNPPRESHRRAPQVAPACITLAPARIAIAPTRETDSHRQTSRSHRQGSEGSALAPIDDDRRAADPAGARRREVRDDVADLFGLAEASERELLLHELDDSSGLDLLPLPP